MPKDSEVFGLIPNGIGKLGRELAVETCQDANDTTDLKTLDFYGFKGSDWSWTCEVNLAGKLAVGFVAVMIVIGSLAI